MTSALVFDTETTGLLAPRAARISRQPNIIEFYGQVVNIPTVDVPPHHYLFFPGAKLPPAITAITGLRDSDLKDKPPFRSRAKKIVALIESVDIVVAHNLSFDKRIIEANLKRDELDAPVWPREICTVEATEHLYGRRMSLSDLYKEIFDDTFKAHRAKADVEALVKIFNKLIEDGEIIL